MGQKSESLTHRKMLERPKDLISAAEMQKRDAIIELAKPKHSEFSRYFPRIRGTPAKFKGVKRSRAKSASLGPNSIPSRYADIHLGLMNFIEWADKVTTHMVKEGEKDASKNPWKLKEPTSISLKPQMHFLFNRFCDMTGVRGKEKASMRQMLDRELIGLKQEFIDYEKQKSEELVS